MKILFVCLEPFPYEGACSNLLYNLLSQRAMLDLGEIHILALNHKDVYSDSELIDEINIHRFTSVTRMTKKQVINNITKDPVNTCRELIYRMKKKTNNNSFYNSVLVDETVNQLKKMHANQFDIIIPVSGYYEASIATLKYSKNYDLEIIFYQLDPCTLNEVMQNNSFEARYSFEREMLKKASHIITTPILKRKDKELFPEIDQEKISEMEFPNVVPCENNSIVSENEGVIKCVFSGRIYPGARNPKSTVELFSRIKETNIIFEMIGVTENQLRQYTDSITENVVLKGELPLAEAKEELSKADYVVNIGNIVKNQVPSKLFDYISTCKPIINICNSNDCPTIDYLKKYPLSISLVPQNDNTAKQLEELLLFIKNNVGKRVAPSLIKQIYQKSTPEYCSLFLSNIIKNIINNKTEQ